MLRRTVISALQPLVANRVYTVRNGLARGLKRRGGLGFLPRIGARVAEETFLERLELTGKTVYDVGGYEGTFTLFFARSVGPSGQVVTFEPNPRSHAHILENVRLNGFANVSVHALALGAQGGRASLVFPAGEAARGSLAREIQDQIRQEPRADTIDVQVESIDGMLERGAVPTPDFVKLDVEGMERAVLDGMSRLLAGDHPRLYIEMHGVDPTAKLENAMSVIDCLWRAGYRVHHVESGCDIATRDQVHVAREGHLYAR